MQLYFVISLDCNLHCSHCIRNFSSKSDEIIDLQSATRVLEEIAKVDSKAQIVLTGGEPTLHKDFFDIVETAKKLFSNVVICSNGVYSPAILEKLCVLKNVAVQISLDGTETAHDRIRGKGNFVKSINSIKTIVEHSVPVRVSSTVNTENIASMLDLAEQLSKLKITKWQVALEQAFSEIEAKRQVDTQTWNNFVDELLAKAKLRVKIKKLYDFALFEKMEQKFGKDFIKANSVQNCGCCGTKMYIYPDLSVRACTCMGSFILGNLKDNSYSEILASMKEKKSLLRIKENSPCAKCEWLYLCNGGCAGYSKYYFGEIGYGDKRCPKVKAFYGL